MKKFTKMLALGMAAALAFGMTVSAAESPSTEAAGIVGAVLAETQVQDSNGNAVDVKIEATGLPESAYTPEFGRNYTEAKEKAIEAVLDALNAAAGSLGNVEVKGYSDIIEMTPAPGTVIPAGGLYVPVVPAEGNEAYVVAHWNGTAWEVLQTKVENGVVYALFPENFSPVFISIIAVSDDQKPADPTPTPAPTTPSDNTSDNGGAPTSPKTGETLPVAGILAVVCLAGVAVCAKKAGFNK